MSVEDIVSRVLFETQCIILKAKMDDGRKPKLLSIPTTADI